MTLEEIRQRLAEQTERNKQIHEHYKHLANTTADDDPEDRHLFSATATPTTYVYSLLHMPTNQSYFGITTYPEARYRQHIEWTKCHIDRQITPVNKHDWLYRELVAYDETTKLEQWTDPNSFNQGAKFVRYQAIYYESQLIDKYRTTLKCYGYNNRSN